MYEQVKIILINTTHPGNIGATARSLKNMGFSDLCLVAPKHFPSDEAIARASGAEDVLKRAVVTDTLEEAIGDCHWVMGLSARERRLSLPMLTPRTASSLITEKLQSAPTGKVALLFGQEQSGLSNEALMKCHYQINIPANPVYASLNVAQAVQIISYELRMAILEKQEASNNNGAIDDTLANLLATAAEMECFYTHLSETLIQIQFLDPKRPGFLMMHLRRLYSKQTLTKVELNILHGILTAMKNSV